jgi:hypothetical protein
VRAECLLYLWQSCKRFASWASACCVVLAVRTSASTSCSGRWHVCRAADKLQHHTT